MYVAGAVQAALLAAVAGREPPRAAGEGQEARLPAAAAVLLRLRILQDQQPLKRNSQQG